MLIKAKVVGTLLKRLEERRRAWAQAQIGARLRVPPELSWWYWQEFGTAASGEEGVASGHTYRIVPINAKALSWPGPNGTRVVRAEVPAHPGIKARRPVRLVLPEIREEAAAATRNAFITGAADNPDHLQQAVLEATKQAKELIADSIATHVPGTREDGKLQGRTAASVFREEAEVVDLSE